METVVRVLSQLQIFLMVFILLASTDENAFQTQLFQEKGAWKGIWGDQVRG